MHYFILTKFEMNFFFNRYGGRYPTPRKEQWKPRGIITSHVTE